MLGWGDSGIDPPARCAKVLVRGLFILSEFYPAVLQEEEKGGGVLGCVGKSKGGISGKKGPRG
jgi:hypothetical protein